MARRACATSFPRNDSALNGSPLHSDLVPVQNTIPAPTLEIVQQLVFLQFGIGRIAFAEESILDQTAEFAVDNMVVIGRLSL